MFAKNFQRLPFESSNADAENLHTFCGQNGTVQKGRRGLVRACVQSTFQIPDLLLLCDSEDVHRAADVAGVTHLQFSGNPRGSGRVSPCICAAKRKSQEGESESSRTNLH